MVKKGLLFSSLRQRKRIVSWNKEKITAERVMEMVENKKNDTLAELKERVAELQLDMQIAAEDTAEAVGQQLENARGQLEAGKENFRLWSERSTGKVSAELLKAKMLLDQKIEELKKGLDEKQIANEKERAKRQMEKAQEYAEATEEFALLAVDEAIVAALTAKEKRLAYEVQYGKIE